MKSDLIVERIIDGFACIRNVSTGALDGLTGSQEKAQSGQEKISAHSNHRLKVVLP